MIMTLILARLAMFNVEREITEIFFGNFVTADYIRRTMFLYIVRELK